MAKKDTTNQEDLNKKLQEAQDQQDQKQDNASQEDLQQLQKLQSKLEETESIAKKAQSDYINLKMDFDSYMARHEAWAKTAEVDSLIAVVKKFIPFINGLHQSLSNIPESEQNDDIVQGVQMVYDKFLSTLESMHIFKIESIWQVVDINLHEAVSAQAVEDDSQKNTIIQEYEQWFVYRKNDIQKILIPAKVVVGQ